MIIIKREKKSTQKSFFVFWVKTCFFFFNFLIYSLDYYLYFLLLNEKIVWKTLVCYLIFHLIHTTCRGDCPTVHVHQLIDSFLILILFPFYSHVICHKTCLFGSKLAKKILPNVWLSSTRTPWLPPNFFLFLCHRSMHASSITYEDTTSRWEKCFV